MRQCNACPDWLDCLPLPASLASLIWLSPLPACLPCLLVSLACLSPLPYLPWLAWQCRPGFDLAMSWDKTLATWVHFRTKLKSVWAAVYILKMSNCYSVCLTVSLSALLYLSHSVPVHLSLSLCACLSATLIWPTDMTVCCILRLIMAYSQAGSQAVVAVITLALWQLWHTHTHVPH